MLKITQVLGLENDEAIHGPLHKLSHKGLVEYLVLDHEDMGRSRFRKATDKGTDCAVGLGRGERLANGSVLLLDDDRAVVVRAAEESWLKLRPNDPAMALELGYFAGNMHWRVAFEGEVLKVALADEARAYLDRLRPLLDRGVEVADGA